MCLQKGLCFGDDDVARESWGVDEEDEEEGRDKAERVQTTRRFIAFQFVRWSRKSTEKTSNMWNNAAEL